MTAGESREPTKVAVSSRLVLDNPWIRVRVDDFRHFDGTPGQFSVVSKSDFVVVLCVVDDALVMVEQYRYAAGCWSLELPQGGLAPGETFEQAGLRELAEETGWVGTGAVLLGHKVHEAADWATQHFRVVEVAPVRRVAPRLETGEAGAGTLLVPFTEIPGLVAAGQIVDAATLAALLVHRMSGSGRDMWPY